MLPDFFIVGAPKAGSTALHAAIASHPGVYMSPVKEPKFFLCEGRRPRQGGPGDRHSSGEWVWGRHAYEALFEAAPPDALKGESTPFYLWDQKAHRRMADTVPGAKLIAVIRNPVDRAHSNWTHLWCDGLEPESSFALACQLEEERVSKGWAPFWRYKELGLYGEQLQSLRSHFDPSQIFILRYRELVDRPAATLDRICRFLGLEEGHLDHIPSSNVSTWVEDNRTNRLLQRSVRAGAAVGAHFPPQVWRQASRPLLRTLRRGGAQRPPLSGAERAALIDYFRSDIQLLSEISGEDYSDWLEETGRGTFSARKAWVPGATVSS